LFNKRYFILASLLFFLFFTASLSVQGASPKKESPPTSSPSKANPSKGKRIFNHYCAVCHGLSARGNGVNADHLDPHPTDLTSEEVQGLTDDEIYEVIDKGGAAVELSVAMPPWGRTLSADQIRDLVAYIRTFSDEAPPSEKGVRLTDVRRGDRSDCQICHMKQGQIRPIAPNLGHEGSKLNPEWLSKFLRDPEKIRPVGFIPLTKSKMPNFQLSDEEVSTLTAFLMTRKDAGVSATPLAGLNLSDPAEIEKGRRFFVDKYACDACHKGGEVGGIVGPDLSSTAERIRPEWVYFWLKNPQAIRPDVAMPNFGIPDPEIRSLIAYVYSLGGGSSQTAKVSGAAPADPALIKKGEKLIKDKNCLACHTMDSFNSQEKRQEKGKETAVAPRS
jgi:mono/diheme cytochrome c family protein